MTRLKPCPFCAGKAIRIDSGNGLAFIVRCGGCGAQTELERCVADADDKWNQRKPDCHPYTCDQPCLGVGYCIRLAAEVTSTPEIIP